MYMFTVQVTASVWRRFGMETRPFLALWSALWAPAHHSRSARDASEGELDEAEALMGASQAH